MLRNGRNPPFVPIDKSSVVPAICTSLHSAAQGTEEAVYLQIEDGPTPAGGGCIKVLGCLWLTATGLYAGLGQLTAKIPAQVKHSEGNIFVQIVGEAASAAVEPQRLSRGRQSRDSSRFHKRLACFFCINRDCDLLGYI